MPNLGGSTVPTLTVAPFDETTSATLTVYKPDGTTETPSPTTADDGATWTAPAVTYDAAGWWVFDWTVTGTGANTQPQRVYVGPVDPLPPNLLPIYISLELFKEASKIPATELTRDDLILRRISAAARRIDDATGRRFWLDTAASARTFTPRGRTVRTDDGELLLIDDLGAAPTVVEYGTGTGYTALDTSAYLTAPDNALVRGRAITSLIRVSSTWPYGSGWRIRVTGRWGWPTIPDPIAEANQILAARLFSRQKAPEGVMGGGESGFIRLARTDPDVAALIEPYVLPGIA